MCPGNPRCSQAEQADLGKRMIFAELDVTRDGEPLGRLQPAKFIFNKSPESPTTEVSMRRSLREDLYAVLGTVNPETKRATFKLHVNLFVSWIWLGLLILMGGTGISLWPEVALGGSRFWAFSKAGAVAATGIMFSLYLAMSPTLASAEPRPRTTPIAMIATSPLPRLLQSGAWIAPVAGLVLGSEFRVSSREKSHDRPIQSSAGAHLRCSAGRHHARRDDRGRCLGRDRARRAGAGRWRAGAGDRAALGERRGPVGDTPLTLDEALGMGAPSTEEEQKRSVLRASSDLEYERSVGKISEQDYREFSERYRADARRLIAAVDASLGPAQAQAEKLASARFASAGLTAETAAPAQETEP